MSSRNFTPLIVPRVSAGADHKELPNAQRDAMTTASRFAQYSGMAHSERIARHEARLLRASGPGNGSADSRAGDCRAQLLQRPEEIRRAPPFDGAAF